MEEDLSTKYTVYPLEDKDHQIILEKWVNDTSQPFKASMCRFFLRGMCIMKREYCKFAHGIDDIVEYEDPSPPESLNQKQKKKWEVTRKSFFNQKALFLCPLSYYNLHEFSKETSSKPIPLEVLNEDDDVRNKLRIKFHRNHWQKFMEYLYKKYPQAIITIPFLSERYVKYGFCKPHTHCKLHMILYWIQQNNFYVRHEITLPPLLDSKVSVICKKYSKRPIDKLLLQDYEYQKELLNKGQKAPQVDKDKLNQELIKQYINGKYVNEKTTICKFYMKGLCMFTEQQCKYCHSFETLKYVPREYKIIDPDYFEQKPLFSEPKLNYLSLFRYQEVLLQKDPNHKFLSQEELNKSTEIRHQIRQIMHMDLYRQFLQKLQELFPKCNWTISFLRRQFTNSGLNKTKVDRFPSFVDKLENLGYEVDSFIVPPYLTVRKEFVFKRPQPQEMEKLFSGLLLEIVQRRLKQSEEEECIILTESYIRRKYYQLQDLFSMPVHRYLKVRNISLKEYIQEQMDSNELLQPYLNRLSFDLKDNIQKIKQTLKHYYNSSKKHQYEYSEIEGYLKKNCEDSIRNYITASSLRWCIIGESLELYKQIYIFPNAEIIICSKKHHKDGEDQKCTCKIEKAVGELHMEEQADVSEAISKYENERVVVVDSQEAILYSKYVLPQIRVVGVDLEGSLREDGFIYLIQFGIKNPRTQKSQVLVFDIWKLQKNQQLLSKAILPLKYVLENQGIAKVMHDCKNDSIALHSLLNICLYPVFDTCAMQVYFDQKELNQNWKEKQEFIRSIFKAYNKTLGLNQILEKYGRPINDLKDYMRKMFEADKETKEKYFEARPLEKDFLQYAVRDVEQLVDTYEAAAKQDQNGIWKQIGLCASTAGLKGSNWKE